MLYSVSQATRRAAVIGKESSTILTSPWYQHQVQGKIFTGTGPVNSFVSIEEMVLLLPQEGIDVKYQMLAEYYKGYLLTLVRPLL